MLYIQGTENIINTINTMPSELSVITATLHGVTTEKNRHCCENIKPYISQNKYVYMREIDSIEHEHFGIKSIRT
jgi:hypothetical protein